LFRLFWAIPYDKKPLPQAQRGRWGRFINELSIKRAQKEALKAKKKGLQYAFDLKDIKDRETKEDFYMYL
jgi:hypothetical protein